MFLKIFFFAQLLFYKFQYLCHVRLNPALIYVLVVMIGLESFFFSNRSVLDLLIFDMKKLYISKCCLFHFRLTIFLWTLFFGTHTKVPKEACHLSWQFKKNTGLTDLQFARMSLLCKCVHRIDVVVNYHWQDLEFLQQSVTPPWGREHSVSTKFQQNALHSPNTLSWSAFSFIVYRVLGQHRWWTNLKISICL